jgi:iron complex outermembrane receptor protein
MKKIYLAILLAWAVAGLAHAQNTLMVLVKDEDHGEYLAGANLSVAGTTTGASTDQRGLAVLRDLPNGKLTLLCTFIGYKPAKQTVVLPLGDTLVFALEHDHEEMEEVVVTSTRSTRTIEEIPTRIEAIAGEELDEKANMSAANISTLLRETPGVQVQQTSATSANMNFRIQGLDGRYTQLLQNGLPLYSGLAGGLSIMQIPPLDLQQVEIIKGSASTLYGGGAIAGIINLITKEPTEKRETSFMVNGTSALGLDLNGFHAQKLGPKWGLTVFSSYHYQTAYDPNHDDFSDIPQQRRFNLNLRLFFQPTAKTKLSLGLNSSFENRQGGFVPQIRGEANPASNYVETNLSQRVASQFRLDHQLGEGSKLFAKNTVNYFDRQISVPGYAFAGRQVASFTELGYANFTQRREWVVGANLWTERFSERQATQGQPRRDYQLATVGAFVQNTYHLGPRFSVESGLRADHQSQFGFFLLPRVSALLRLGEHFSSRLGGGLGYKTPTIFTEEIERNIFRNVRPIDAARSRAETSQGLNLDFNYRAEQAEGFGISVNQMFFATRLNQPLVLDQGLLGQNILALTNGNGYIDTRGFETNLKLSYRDFKLFGFYTFIDTRQKYDQLDQSLPLTARHRTGTVLMYERHGKIRIGYEVYYVGPQTLGDGTSTRDYFNMGFMAEKWFGNMSVYINFENFTDSRMSRWQAMYTGTVQAPQFVGELYAPTDGRIVNGGVKVRF